MSERPGDWIALLDQVLAALPDQAKIIRAYYESLTDSGFTRGEALMLTAQFQKELLSSGGDDA